MLWNTRRITKNEYREIKSRLRGEGFYQKDLDIIDQIFRGDLGEPGSGISNIDEKELEQALKWIKNNKNKHDLSNKQIEILEKSFRDKL